MPSREARAVARRRVLRRRRQVAAAGFLLCCTVIAVAGFRLAAALTSDPIGGAISVSAARATTSQPPARSTRTSPTTSSPRDSASGDLASARPALRATGAYARAPGGSGRHGSGTLKTYRVEVETGIGQSAPAFAAAVDETLADPASWTGKGLWSLQRVAGENVDFIIRLATPATVDKVCATSGLDTRGYVSCRSGLFVMINLDRWQDAVPHYRGDIAMYRRYVINHEVGHQLGYGHTACPGPGRLAPVMQQQTFGLDGCVANGSPYVNGKLVSGPATR